MKRLLLLLLCFCLIFCMASVSFAADERYINDTSYQFLIDKGDSNTYLGVFDLFSMSDEVKDFVMGFWTGSDYTRNYIVTVGTYSVRFYAYLSDDQLVYSPNAGIPHWNNAHLASGGRFEYVEFSYQSSGGLLVAKTTVVKTSISITESNVLFPPDILPNFQEGQRLYYRGDLGFVDNDDLPVDPDPSSSEPPSSSNPPIIPELPNIDSPYVPYDTTAWNDFIPFVLDYIRKAASVGLFILAIWSGIVLIKKIVKMFLRGKL